MVNSSLVGKLTSDEQCKIWSVIDLEYSTCILTFSLTILNCFSCDSDLHDIKS